MGSRGINITHLRIEYWADDTKGIREVDVDTAVDAARWMYLNLKDWCVDNDICVYIDGELAEKTYIEYKEPEICDRCGYDGRLL